MPGEAPQRLSFGGADSEEGSRFKAGLRDLHQMIRASVAADTLGENGPVRFLFDLATEARTTLQAIDPALTIPRRAAALVRIPPRIREEITEEFTEVMAYPVFDLPMLRPLADLSGEFLIPNVNLIENNSVTLLETNQKFVEAYLVGLNHELARELLAARGKQ